MPAISRRAFTLMELLVAISIIGMMLALLLPAVMQSREAARRSQCANNLRNVALALQGAVNAHRRLPAAGNFSTKGDAYHGWVVDVLPLLERGDIASKWDFDVPYAKKPNASLGLIRLSVLLCPDSGAADNQWQEYVIVHELLHLQIPNHGKLFKAMMSALLPDWQSTASHPPRTAPSLSLSRESSMEHAKPLKTREKMAEVHGNRTHRPRGSRAAQRF